MKLTKEQESEVIPIYKEWWHSYLNGDVKTYDHYLDDDYRFVGSTVAEDFLNKLDTTKFFDDTAEQLAGKTQKRNSKLTTEYYDGIIFITELADAYLLFGDEWTFYGKFRFSSMLRKGSDGWRFIYQHFSVPDSKAQEGETIGFEQVSKENQELRGAIKRRTAELENKNRELEIESALDRVRSTSMAMQESEELASVARTVFEQLRVLGIDVYRSWIDIFHVEEGYVLTWSTDFEGNFQSNPATFPLDFDETMSDFYRDYKSTSRFIELEAHGDDVREWFDYLYSVSSDPIFRIPSVPDDLYQIWAKHKYGTVATTKLSPLTEDEKDILNRFARVFEQAYTRFLDLQKAEAQAREAKIEAALERVRARTMGMQQSNELSDVATVLFEGLTGLGGNLWSCGFGLVQQENDCTAFWTTNPEGEVEPSFTIPNSEDFTHRAISKHWQSGDKYFSSILEGEAIQSHYDYMVSLPETGEVFQAVLDEGIEFPTWQQNHAAYFSHGYLLIITLEPYENKDLLIRFAQVFEQTYTRFLDLKKAEAQAREAQIETALEKVRSRTMAMQSSDELTKAATEMFSQIKSLGLNPWSCGFNIFNDDKTVISQWVSTGDGRPIEPFDTPANEGIFKRIVEQSENDEPLYIEKMEGKKLEDTYKYMASLPTLDKIFEELDVAGIELPQKQVDHAAYFKQGYLMFITFEETPEFHSIFKRFANVFEQTYTRFLDLKKAEKQARESQIETALERIRSSSLAMHKTDDLRDVVGVLFEQMQELSVDMGFASVSIFIFEEGSRDFVQWLPLPDGVASLNVPYIDHPISSDLFDAWESGTGYFEKVYSVEEKNAWAEKGFELTDYKNLPDEFKTSLLEAPGYAMSISLAKHSGICIPSFEGKLSSSENIAILKRVGKVFEQAYTRFLDLQKAEEQAREAKIEAALEKVRSRTMGMQSSDELPEVANLLFLEVQALGIPAWSCGYCILLEDRKSSTCIMSSEGTLQKPFMLPHYGEVSFEEWDNFVQSEETFFTQELGGNAIESHYNFMKSLPQLTPIFKELEDAGLSLPTYQINHLCKFNDGFLLFITYEDVPGSHDIFKRFTKVFDQTYTRFLDLKKAEAQARKAEIEASLERVRAKTMSMQDSNELNEVLAVLCEQFDVLGIVPMSAHMTVFDFDNNTFTFRETGKYGDRSFGEQTVKLDAMDTWKDTVDSWKADEATTVNKLHFPPESLSEVWEVFHESFSSMPEGSRITPYDYPDGIYHTAGKHPFGYIGMNQTRPATVKEEEIVIKFANEFGRAYQRFLDLKKAEAQAREAQIELSLERIRAEVTAMNKSSDLFDVVVKMRNEFITLGHEADYFWHMSWLPDSYEMSMTSEDGSRIGMVISLPKFVHEDIPDLIEWEKGIEPIYVLALGANEAWEYIQNMNTHGHYEQADPNAPTQDDIQHIGGLTFIIARTTHGEIGYSLPGVVPNPPQNALNTLERFAGVFDLAYRRFEDLQESEKQARLILEERDRLEAALKELHDTQDQLVQQEKLASLGQLTAGIAHEIKNPLNFVNNFSDLSMELVEEVRQEMRRMTEDGGQEIPPLSRGDGIAEGDGRGVSNGGQDHDLILEILDDIETNLKTIHKHGTRADSIVKSMLQHSRGGDGKMELTPLNPIIKEYVNLAFHGMRAGKDPINVDIDLQLDDEVGEVPLVAEDFSRVLLNLVNNAFDAMGEKAKGKSEKSPFEGGSERSEQGDDSKHDYHPKLTVKTQKIGTTVIIDIEDNGPGIPDEMKDKILQPFFTTKKGTQGTGLGLSITNDIIKAHGGSLDVQSQPGQTIFTIKLTG